MKILLILLLSTLSFSFYPQPETQKAKSEYVYICNGPSSKKYHRSSHCRGLSNCSAQLQKISKTQAAQKGRTACKICYK